MSNPDSPISTTPPPDRSVAGLDPKRTDSSVTTSKVRTSANGLLPREIADSIVAAFAGLEFGSIEITVHNSRVVQIERHERIRFSGTPTRPDAGPSTAPSSPKPS